jgi:hypothetical protein
MWIVVPAHCSGTVIYQFGAWCEANCSVVPANFTGTDILYTILLVTSLMQFVTSKMLDHKHIPLYVLLGADNCHYVCCGVQLASVWSKLTVHFASIEHTVHQKKENNMDLGESCWSEKASKLWLSGPQWMSADKDGGQGDVGYDCDHARITLVLWQLLYPELETLSH